MPPMGFKLAVSASEKPQTYALHRTATGIGCFVCKVIFTQSSNSIEHYRK